MPSKYKGNNATLKTLTNLAELFHKCYLNGLYKTDIKITLNILLNYYLIDPINIYINVNKNKSDKVFIDTFTNCFKKDEKEKSYLYNYFGNDFNVK